MGTYLPGYPRQARQVLLALNEVLHLIRVHFRETRKVVRRGGLDILFPVTGNEDFRPKEPVENAWMKSWSWPIFVVGCQKKGRIPRASQLQELNLYSVWGFRGFILQVIVRLVDSLVPKCSILEWPNILKNVYNCEVFGAIGQMFLA